VESVIFRKKICCRSLQLSLGAQRGAKFLCTGMTKNCEKNMIRNTSVNLKFVDFLSYVKANRNSVGQTPSAINSNNVYSEHYKKEGK